jgi:hypothetical protein
MCNYDIEVRNKVWNNISDMVEELTAIPILLNNRKIVEEDLEIMWRMIG